jgi:hypothetical protein
MNELVGFCMACIEMSAETQYITLGLSACRISELRRSYNRWRRHPLGSVAYKTHKSQSTQFQTRVSHNKSQLCACHGLNYIETEFSMHTEMLSSQYLIYTSPAPSLVERRERACTV